MVKISLQLYHDDDKIAEYVAHSDDFSTPNLLIVLSIQTLRSLFAVFQKNLIVDQEIIPARNVDDSTDS